MSDTEVQETKKKEWLIKPGQVLNPKGRPKGARCRFGEDFIKQYSQHWFMNGEPVLDRLAREHPEAYARIACMILPKVIEFDDETKEVLEKVAAAAQLPFNVIRSKAEEIEYTDSH